MMVTLKSFAFCGVLVLAAVALLGTARGHAQLLTPAVHTEAHTSALAAVVDSEGRPTKVVCDLALALGLPLSECPSLLEIVEKTQAAWLRPAGTERWQLTDRFEARRSECVPFFQRLSLLDAVQPRQKSYSYLLLLGGSVHALVSRMGYVVELFNQGIRWEKIAFLTGQRMIDPQHEPLAQFLQPQGANWVVRPGWLPPTKMPTTETELMRLMWDQLDLAPGLRACPMVVIDSLQRGDGRGGMRRPNTGETVQDWLAQDGPKPGACLVVSSQPHVGYQDAVVRTHLPTGGGWRVETVGPACESGAESGAVILDALARWLYQEKCCLEKSRPLP